jgi:hypothetical protein
MTKYYKRGQREYYRVTPDKIVRIVNGAAASYIYITVAHQEDTPEPIGTTYGMIVCDAYEGEEITREEFAKEFEIASRLIVLEP